MSPVQNVSEEETWHNLSEEKDNRQEEEKKQNMSRRGGWAGPQSCRIRSETQRGGW